MTISGMSPLVAAPLLIFVFAFACPKSADALQCGGPYWRNFDRTDNNADPEKRRQDAEARAALANLSPIIFRGRVVWVRDLSDLRTRLESPVRLVAFEHVEVLRGELPRSADDQKAFIVEHGWCDSSPGCGSASRLVWPRGQTFTPGVRPFGGGAVIVGKKVAYKGRVDAEMYACDPRRLTPLQEELLNAPADEIARLLREYLFHPPTSGTD